MCVLLFFFLMIRRPPRSSLFPNTALFRSDRKSTRLNSSYIFFFNDSAPPEIYTLSLHDALPICEAAHRVVGQFVEDAGGRQERGVRVVKRVPVGACLRCCGCGHRRPCTGPVLDDNLLPEQLAQRSGENSRQGIRAAAGRVSDQQSDRLVRIVLCMGSARERQQGTGQQSPHRCTTVHSYTT